MAQADDSAPRKTTTYKRFEGMASQNERYNTKPDEMFWLENIMRVSPKRLHSVPGPTANLFNPLQPCVIDTPREHQVLSQVACTDIQTGFPLGKFSGNSRASWGLVKNGITIAAVYDVVTTNYQILELNVSQGIVIQELTPITTPFFGNLLQCGHSDEQSYAFFGGVGGGDSAIWYFSWPQQRVTRFIKADPFSETAERWAKNGIYFYIAQQSGSSVIIQQFSFPGVLQPDGTYTGTFVQENNTTFDQPTPSDPTFGIVDLQATDNFVYVMVRKNPAGAQEQPGQLYKLNVSDLSVSDSFQFDYFTTINPTNNASPLLMYVASDDLVYIQRISNLSTSGFAGRASEFGYVDWTTHAYEYIDRVTTNELTCAGVSGSPTMVFENGNFYYGGSAQPIFGGSIDIAKIGPVDCPGVFHGGLLVSQAQLEFPDAALHGQVTYAAFSTPTVSAGYVTWGGFLSEETQDAGFITQAYFELPSTPVEADVVIVKSADQSRSSDITLTADSELKFTMGAGETWAFLINVLLTAASATPDINYTVSGPAGATGKWSDQFTFTTLDLGGGPSGTALNTGVLSVLINGSATCGGTGGDITFDWGQANSSTDATTVMHFSQLLAFKTT